jgi:hypothetical protein
MTAHDFVGYCIGFSILCVGVALILMARKM